MMGISEFFSMVGYAFYVWWSFGAVAALIIAEWVYTGMQRKATIQRLQRMARLNETQDKLGRIRSNDETPT